MPMDRMEQTLAAHVSGLVEAGTAKGAEAVVTEVRRASSNRGPRFLLQGEGDKEFWLFEPADPTPRSAPVVVMIHGFGAMSPNIYGAWIEHLVRRGNSVVYPRYQANLKTSVDTFTANTVHAVRNGLNTLRLPGHVLP